MEPTVDPDKCDICRECIDACPNDVFDFIENKIVVLFPEDCVECMSCVDICHKNAIYMDD